MKQDSRHVFFTFLRSSLMQGDFARQTALLLERDPFFLPAYLEHFWLAEKSNDVLLQKELVIHIKKIINHLYTDTFARNEVCEKWSDFEMQALTELLSILHAYEPTTKGKLLTRLQMITKDTRFPIKTNLSPTELFLKKMVEVDIKPLQKEIKDLNPYWWNINKVRAENNSYHQHTHALILRALSHTSSDYSPIDGVHESSPDEIYVKKFEKIHETILDFAVQENIGLGRVALVRLAPGMQSYRHYDFEHYLVDRRRYHLVIQAGSGNMLSSGTETVEARPGDIWFFDNKVMHRAHNKSLVPRIHVIFDGYPL